MFLTVISALLLILSFPKFSLWPAAWVAFVPIVHVIWKTKDLKWGFLYFYIFGLLFFFTSVEWLRHVTYFGWFFVSLAYPGYFATFGIIASWFFKRGRFLLSLLVLPSAWCVLEWIRTEIPVWGFGWNLLAYSQTANLGMAQLAGFTGAYGVSWLIIFINLAIFFILRLIFVRKKSEIPAALFSLVGLVLILGFMFVHRLDRAVREEGQPLIRTAVIQANISQEQKWDPRYKSSILETHEKLSRFVGYDKQLELIIWPEAAFPGYLNLDPNRERILQLERELKIPILLGSPHLEPSLNRQKEVAYNSAYLVDERLTFEDRYDKIRLVSFGEYVPWRWLFGPLGIERFAYSIGVSDFKPGKDIKIFSLSGKERRLFSVLICFEDTFPNLAKRAADLGAQFLVVVTNDAWFSRSAAAYQHLQASIFRAIENGVPVIRAANTGVSAFIDGRGVVRGRVKDKYGHDSFVAGGLIQSVPLEGHKTFYREKGYQFPLYCLIFVFVSFLFTLNVKTEHTL